MAEARIDKWMWATRIFKTRTIACEACKKGRIAINGALVKPSRMARDDGERHTQGTIRIVGNESYKRIC